MASRSSHELAERYHDLLDEDTGLLEIVRKLDAAYGAANPTSVMRSRASEFVLPSGKRETGGRTRKRRRRTSMWLPVILVAALLVALSAASAKGSITDLGQPMNLVSTLVYFPISGFHPVKEQLHEGKKPLLLFMGAQGPNYDAINVERWPLVKALVQFGSLKGVKEIDAHCVPAQGGSPPDQLVCSEATFDLTHAQYSSPYLAFQSVDMIHPVHGVSKVFQKSSATAMKIFDKYARFRGTPYCYSTGSDGKGVNKPCKGYVHVVESSISGNGTSPRKLPILTIGGYLQTVSQDLVAQELYQTITPTQGPGTQTFSPPIYRAWPFATVRSALISERDPDPLSHLVEDMNAEANIITALICHADGKKPASACTRPAIKTILRSVK